VIFGNKPVVLAESDKNIPKSKWAIKALKNSTSSKEFGPGARAYLPVKSFHEIHENRCPYTDGDKNDIPRPCVKHVDMKPSNELLKFNEKSKFLPH